MKFLAILILFPLVTVLAQRGDIGFTDDVDDSWNIQQNNWDGDDWRGDTPSWETGTGPVVDASSFSAPVQFAEPVQFEEPVQFQEPVQFPTVSQFETENVQVPFGIDTDYVQYGIGNNHNHDEHFGHYGKKCKVLKGYGSHNLYHHVYHTYGHPNNKGYSGYQGNQQYIAGNGQFYQNSLPLMASSTGY